MHLVQSLEGGLFVLFVTHGEAVIGQYLDSNDKKMFVSG